MMFVVRIYSPRKVIEIARNSNVIIAMISCKIAIIFRKIALNIIQYSVYKNQ